MEARAVGYVGGPGTGKTQLALRHLLRFHVDGVSCYIVDVNRDIPDHLWDGTRLPLARHDALWRVGLSRAVRRGAERAIHVIPGKGREREVMQAVAAWHPHQDDPAVVLIDEAGKWREAGKHRIAEGLADYLADRRHFGVSILWGAQFPRQIHYSLVEQSNYVFAFGMTSREDLSRLQAGGVSDVARAKVEAIGREDQARDERGEDSSHEWVLCRVLGQGFPPIIERAKKVTP